MEVKKAVSQEDMRRADMSKGRQNDSGYGYYQMRESSYRGGGPYGGGRSGGYDSYHRMSGEGR